MYYIYGSEKSYNKRPKKVPFAIYRKRLLMRQPLWWILESLDLEHKPFRHTKERIVDENIDDLWDTFLDGLDHVDV